MKNNGHWIKLRTPRIFAYSTLITCDDIICHKAYFMSLFYLANTLTLPLNAGPIMSIGVLTGPTIVNFLNGFVPSEYCDPCKVYSSTSLRDKRVGFPQVVLNGDQCRLRSEHLLKLYLRVSEIREQKLYLSAIKLHTTKDFVYCY